MTRQRCLWGSLVLLQFVLIGGFGAAEGDLLITGDRAQFAGPAVTEPAVSLADQEQLAGADDTGRNPSGPKDNFDRIRYIDTSEIKRGMKGYGLTVFAGTEPERFDVEVISVVHNFMPKMDIILVRCLDERHRISNPVGGDSGSPVFFDNRLAGALAYGWFYSKEPLYGVTPIRHMLNVQETANLKMGAQATTSGRSHVFDRDVYRDLMRDELLTKEQIYQLVKASGLVRGSVQSTQNGWQMLPLSLTVGGFSPQAIEHLQDWIPGLALESGGGGASSGGGGSRAAEKIKLQRGSALTIPLVTGDMSMRVLGTATEVDGDKVFGFGHPFQAEGKATWPMGTGYIHKVVNKTDRSFKLGEAVDVIGMIEVDESAAVYGRIGKKAPMIPMEVKVRWPQQAQTEQFTMQLLQHELLDPALVASVILDALLMRGELPRENTVRYQMKMEFDGAESLEFKNSTSGPYGWNDMLSESLSVVALMLDNPWEKVKLAGVQVEMEVEAQETVGYIKSITLGQRRYRPGETVQAEFVVEQLRQKEKTLTVGMSLPEDLAPGKYKVTVGSESFYRRQIQQAQPHRNIAFKSSDIQRILQERLQIDRRGVYMSMILQRQGVALEDQQFEDLPGSKTMLLTDKSRGFTTTPFRPLVSASKITEYVITGGKIFEVDVRKD